MHRHTWVALAGIIALLAGSLIPGLVLGARPLPLGWSFTTVSVSDNARVTRKVEVTPADAAKKYANVNAQLTVEEGGAPILRAEDNLAVNRESTYPETGSMQQLQVVEPALPVPPLEREGLTYFFPAETEKRSYPYFDPVLRFSTPIDYLREDKFGDLKALTFAQDIPVQKLTWLDVSPRRGDAQDFYTPAEQQRFGFSPTTHVVLEPYYGVTRQASVDPFTGTVVDLHEDVWSVWATDAQQAQDRSQVPERRKIFIADLRWDDATREHAMSIVSPRISLQRNMAALAWAGKALGVVALGYAAYGFLQRRRSA